MTISPLKTFYWQVRREFWEHRSLVIAPLIILAILFPVMLTLALRTEGPQGVLSLGMGVIGNIDAEVAAQAIKLVFTFLNAVFLGAMVLVAMFYLLDSLYAERRDRSVLFWKSLPISDTSTVLSKLFVGAAIVPQIAVVAALVGYLMFAVVASFEFGQLENFPASRLWNPLHILSAAGFQMRQNFMFALWHLPIFAWFLACSVVVRKLPVLFALGIPALIVLAEYLLHGDSVLRELWSNYFAQYKASTVPEEWLLNEQLLEKFDTDVTIGVDGEIDRRSLLQALQKPAFYMGMVISAVFVAGAVWWRRNRIDLG